MIQVRIFHRPSLISLLFCFFISSIPPAFAFDPYLAPRLAISLTTLQTTLEKVGGPVTFAPRPGSQQGTQEARLPGNAGIVQAGGGAENLAAVVLWLPVDAKGQLVGAQARPYLDAFVGLFLSDSEETIRWVGQALARATTESGKDPHLESRLLDKHQFKLSYVPTLSPPMCSLTVTAASDVR